MRWQETKVDLLRSIEQGIDFTINDSSLPYANECTDPFNTKPQLHARNGRVEMQNIRIDY